MIRISLAIAVAVGFILALTAGPASASDVTCGDVISADTTLDSDLVDCPNNGIVIGADDITLDLNGHRIDGDAAPAVGCDPDTEWCDVGVLNEGRDGITIKHGSVRGFDFGVLVGGAHENRVKRVTSTANFVFGALVFLSTRIVIRGSTFSHNIPPEGDGIGLFGCRRSRIVDSEIRDNAGPGIHVGDSDGNLIKWNLFSHDGPSISIQGDRNEVLRNRVVGGGGILVGPGDQNVIAHNSVLRADDSIAIEKGRGNLVARNVVARPRGEGIRLGIGAPPIGGADNVVRRNLVRRASDDGFLVTKNDGHSVLRRNVAVAAGDDGFDVRGHSTKVERNRSFHNGDLGIAAVRGTIDGGGNKAHGNGDPVQCLHIVCS